MEIRTIPHSSCFNFPIASGPDHSLSLETISVKFQRLLLDDILPLWSTVGRDCGGGGFCEMISRDCTVPDGPRRIRVSARQVYAFCVASELGWDRNAAEACVRHGVRFLERYCSDEGLLHHVLGVDGTVGGQHDLYDQAFLLLSYAHAYRMLDEDVFVQRGKVLLQSIRRRFDNPSGGFADATDKPHPLRSNPHMHLLEAALAWAVADPSPLWRDFANEMVSLFKARLFDDERGLVRELFDSNWQAIVEGGQYRVEPGHNFEWAWLLLRWEKIAGGDCGDYPHRMVHFAEVYGYDEIRHVSVNELWSDGSPADSNARLWPQTERLKAWLAMAEIQAGKARWRAEMYALDAAETLLRYVATDARGLWHDVMIEDGRFKADVSPASSLYHIICALRELAHYVGHAAKLHPPVEETPQLAAVGKAATLQAEF